MELTNDFRVSAARPVAWQLLTDVERIAPMLPGAQLQEVEGEEYRGVVKVKVGPITAQYKGTATFMEQDEAAGRVVLRASGRDTRGQGNASATITAVMLPDGDGTRVTVTTDLTVTGKVAQFGRGVLADVSGKLIGQFVDALEADLEKGPAPEPVIAAPVESDGAKETTGGPAPSTTSAPLASGPRRIDGPEAQPVDLLDAAGGSVLKRAAPIIGAVGAVTVVMLWRKRRATRRRRAKLALNLDSLRHLPSRLPDIHLPSELPNVPEWAGRVTHRRR